jgi:hypothetical protein
MKIEDLSFCVEVNDENTSDVNGGYIRYEDIAFANAGWFEYAGDSLEAIGADGSLSYGAAIDWLESI